MKLLIVILTAVWLACGLFGAWRLDDHRLSSIARGPLMLAKASKDAPMSYPGPS